MWLRILACSAAAVLAISSAMPASAAAGRPGREGDVYLALGNSLAAGVGASNPRRLGYVAHVFNMSRSVRGPGADRLVNLAVPGETSRSFVEGKQLGLAVAAIADPNTDVRLVTLDIGGNDLLGLLSPGGPCAEDPSAGACLAAVGSALAGFGPRYAAILSALREALASDPGDEPLLVMTYYNPYSGTGNTAFEQAIDAALLGSDRRIDCAALASGGPRVGLNDLIACMGASAGATIVDVYPLFRGRAQVLTHIRAGDVHPSNVGHLTIALAFRRELR